ncbi:MAG TPA: hypothetical protein VMS98_01570 [Thermoanaerobaculia bacterium]|nr:hypothetical protein [Thermoanaerobaculia bacterium]
MTDEACRRYLEEPEAHAAHLGQCAECRRVFGNLEVPVEHRPVRVEALPLAPWEGAGHRAWALVIGGSIGLAALAMALFAAAGVSPLQMNLPSTDVVLSIFRLFSGAIQNAPATWQIAIGIAFVAVNALFVVLLRRAPRGIDV